MSVAMMRLCVLQIHLYSRRDGQKITLTILAQRFVIF